MVIAIITILIAILLPALSAARRQAQRIACSSNMRQLGVAFIAYASDNRGWFPAPAGNWASRFYLEDGVHWQPGRNLRDSAILPYLNYDPKVLKCPSGFEERATTPPFPFSYSVNNQFTGACFGLQFGIGWNNAPCRLGECRDPSVKILLIEADVTAISDGEWWSGELEHDTLRKTSLSVIHDRGREYGSTSLADGQYWFQGRGNVVFADGHCDFIDRTKLLFKGWIDPHHQGGPY